MLMAYDNDLRNLEQLSLFLQHDNGLYFDSFALVFNSTVFAPVKLTPGCDRGNL